MSQPAKIEFLVDETYENEKGVFKVVSIHRDQMVIRWENGEEIRTDIELQKRIAERRQWEHYKRENEKAAAAKPSAASTAEANRKTFAGFVPTDFKNTASGTKWRSRSQLGRAVASITGGDTPLKFNSWAYGHKPEMHVQDSEHRGEAAGDHQARFFVRLDSGTLTYGFRVARPDAPDKEQADWNAFCRWLAEPENEKMVHTLAQEYNLAVTSPAYPLAGSLHPLAEGWGVDSNQKPSAANGITLVQYLAEAPETGSFDVEVAAVMDKDEVLERGVDIAETIARLFTRLLPLYQAALIY